MTHELVGRKVNLRITEDSVHYKLSNKTVTFKRYSLDDPEMENLIKETFSNVRILCPGQMGTADHHPFRVNVHIDENGIITQVTNG